MKVGLAEQSTPGPTAVNEENVCTCTCVMVVVMMVTKTRVAQQKLLQWKILLELRLPVEYAAVIQGVLCIVGNSISHNITMPPQCGPCRVILRLDHVQDGMIVLSFIQL